ncbi:mandelate racemase/muconate lactonizing enzyme family protein [Asticcacaulis sp. BYS171W]|uniref:Mandelate racemase/muconate lactonizing enzyme family protein n=1 Tax=Asticcacaulis aquaticus TaxID=2984212 RepID=A0ABT5HVN5_9CAUL|nr:mandelate racemase/muconate lactonizing enzyme family protein [Asticcacaulis aquaticus]MDC7684152.1 mandelate racemase/muconate lactonizing enzyme family protein [Asticcacaulis aquaticus]
MKISGYRSLSTVHLWNRAVGDVNGVVESGITEVPLLILETDSGLEGVGLGPHAEITRLFPCIEHEDPRAVAALYDRMLAQVFKSGHAGATFGTIAALDMALWDLKAKMANEPLWRLLGGRDRFVPGYASGLCYGLDDAALITLYEQWADRGFASAKVKGGRDLDRDIRRLLMVHDVMARNSVRPALMLDVNEAWSRKQAIRHLHEIERHIDLTWIEEPLRRWDVEGHAMVARAVKTAVATGENLSGLEQFTPLLGSGAVDVVQTGSVWGITHFLRVATAAHAHNLPVSPVAYDTNPVAHAAATVPNCLSIELQDFHAPLGLSVDQQIIDGGIVLGDAPGLGIAVDEAAIAANRLSGQWTVPNGPHVRPARAGLRLVPEH